MKELNKKFGYWKKNKKPETFPHKKFQKFHLRLVNKPYITTRKPNTIPAN